MQGRAGVLLLCARTGGGGGDWSWPLSIGPCWVTQPASQPASQPAVIPRNLVMSRSPRLGQDRYDIYN